MRPRGPRFSLFDLTGFVLVAAMALAPLSAGVNALGEACHRAVVGTCIVATAGALLGRGRGRVLRLGFAAGAGLFLLVSGWFQVPGVSGRPDLGRILQAALAIAVGILGGLLIGRLTATAGAAGGGSGPVRSGGSVGTGRVAPVGRRAGCGNEHGVPITTEQEPTTSA